MAISVVQSKAISNAFTGSFTANVTAGNTVFISIQCYATTNVTISSSSPTLGGSSVAGSVKLLELLSAWDATTTSETFTAVWMLPNCPGGSSSVAVTVTNGSVNSVTGLILYEVAGLGPAPVLDQSASAVSAAAGSSAVASGTTPAITGAPEFILGGAAIWQAATADPGAPWTSLDVSLNGCSGYQIATSSGGTYSWSQTGASVGPWTAGIVTVVAGATGVSYAPQRYAPGAAVSPVPWEQRPYRSVPGAADTPANPLPSPLDTAWQADGLYSHAYADTATHDRRAYFTQRAYVSPPGLLATAELENELLGGADYSRQFAAAAYVDRRLVPQQPARLADPLLIQTAQLENELLGGAQTWLHYVTAAYYDRRLVPQQRAYISDPSVYPPQNNLDPLLAGEDLLDGHQHQAATHYDRREVPQQRAYISDPSFYPTGAATDPLTVAWGAGGNCWHLYNRAGDITDRREYFTQRLYISDPLLLTTALLENELLGGAETPKYYRAAATHADRREVPQQRAYYDISLLATAELENELLGGGQTARYYLTPCYWDRREAPQQRPYGSDPLLLVPPVPLDPTQSAWAALWLAYNLGATHYDRRLVPQQRQYWPLPAPAPLFTVGTLTASAAATATQAPAAAAVSTLTARTAPSTTT